MQGVKVKNDHKLLTPGEYYLCGCKKSKRAPFCVCADHVRSPPPDSAVPFECAMELPRRLMLTSCCPPCVTPIGGINMEP